LIVNIYNIYSENVFFFGKMFTEKLQVNFV
jgi:hypothetical protein